MHDYIYQDITIYEAFNVIIAAEIHTSLRLAISMTGIAIRLYDGQNICSVLYVGCIARRRPPIPVYQVFFVLFFAGCEI